MDATTAVAHWQMWVTFAGIFAAIVVFSLDKFPIEITAATILAAFMIFFVVFPVTTPEDGNLLGPETILQGFANPALITIMALLVVGQGLFQTGALDQPTRIFVTLARKRPHLVLGLVLLSVAITSGVLNNTPVVVMFIPIVSAIAQRAGLVPSKIMMPLTYMCILGGMTTLIGSSTNLLVAHAAHDLNPALAIGFFDQTPLGIILASVGAVYVLLILPRLLPAYHTLADSLIEGGKQFIVDVRIGPGHSLLGAQAVAGRFKELPDITVRLIQRGEQSILPPFEDVVLKEGDEIVLATTRDALTALLSSKPEFLRGMISQGLENEELGLDGKELQIANDLVMTEAVVAPGSRFVGYTVDFIGFRAHTNCIVLGIRRRSRMYRSNLQQIRLEAGDVLLLLGRRDNVRGLRKHRDLLLLEWAMIEIPNLDKVMVGRLIFAGVLVSAATGILPIVASAVAGAVLMVMTECINVRQAARAFDRRIYILVGSALAMGSALEQTGGAAYLANSLVTLFAGASVAVVLSAFFLLVSATTNVLSNNATAILFTPIAVGMAGHLGVDPTAFIFAVLFAANSSFATPMGYQTNLLVMGPGQYGFWDFMRAGLPLTLLIWATFSLVAPWYFNLGP